MVVDAQTVRQAVIAIINLQPNGLPADELNGDYKKMEGSDIPFRSMGYNSLLKFVEEEFKERVRIERQVETNEVFLFPIATGKSGHIVDLIKGEDVDKDKRRKRVPMLTSNKNTKVGGQQCGQPSAMHYIQGNNPHWAQQMSKTRENQLKIIKNYEQFGGHKEPSLDDLDNQEQTDQGKKQGPKSHINENQFYRRPKLQTGPFQMQRPRGAVSTEARNEFISSLKKQYQTGDHYDRRGAQRYDKRNNRKMSASDRLKTNSTNDDNQFESVYEWGDVLRDIDDLALSVVDERRNIDMDPSPEELLESCIADNNRQTSISCASAIINHVDNISFSLTKNDAIELAYAWKELSVGDQFECTLEEINNPLKFWLRMKKDVEAFNTLSQNLNTFYNRHEMKLKLWDDDLDEHELFACCYRDEWYRVRAENKLQNSKVQVRFVDTGARDDVKMDELRRLPSEFMKVPILAICSALGNIWPINQNFTAASAESIIDLTENKDLIAKVLNIDHYKSKIMVNLKIKESSLDIAECLVQDGHATFRLQK